MANKRARDRQLAKLAARRQAERAAQQRRRARIVGGITGLAVTGLVVAGVLALSGNDTPKATSTPCTSTSPSAAGGPCSSKVPKTAGEKKPTFKHAPEMTIDPK